MTAVSGGWADSQALPKPAFDYVSAKWASSTTCLTVGNNGQSSAVLRSSDSGHTWTEVTDNNAMQGFLLTDIAAGPSNVYVITGRNVDNRARRQLTTHIGGNLDSNYGPDGVVYTSKDGINFSSAKGSNGLVSPGAGLNGAAVGSNLVAFVVGDEGKIYRSVADTENNDFISWADVTPGLSTVMRSNKCYTTFYLTCE